MAWSVVWILDAEAAAKAAEAKLAEQAFVERFLAGFDVTVDGRHAVVPGPPPVHLDLLPLRAGRTVALLVLGDSPAPFRDAAAVAGRLRRRLA
jgi:hypothetical protein